MIFTSAEDRQVKLWSAKDGSYIESLRQNKDEKGAKPIAYKKFGTKYIYATDKMTRIDIHKKRKKKSKNKEKAEDKNEAENEIEPKE